MIDLKKISHRLLVISPLPLSLPACFASPWLGVAAYLLGMAGAFAMIRHDLKA